MKPSLFRMLFVSALSLLVFADAALTLSSASRRRRHRRRHINRVESRLDSRIQSKDPVGTLSLLKERELRTSDHLRYSLDAADLLKRQAEETGDPLGMWTQLRELGPLESFWSEEALRGSEPKDRQKVKEGLESGVTMLQERALAVGLAWITESVLPGRWDHAGAWMREYSAVVGELDTGLEPLLEHLSAFQAREVQRGEVRKLETQVRRSLTSELLRKVQEKNPRWVSATLEREVAGLEAVKVLREAMARRGPDQDWEGLAGKIGDLKRTVPPLARDLTQLQQDLALKCFLEGNPREALALLPDDGDPQHYAAQLRDLKVLAAQEGEVKTWSAVQSAGGTEIHEGAPRGPPPGLNLLMPQPGAAEGSRPTVRESARADLPPLDVLDRAEADLGPKAEKEGARLGEELQGWLSEEGQTLAGLNAALGRQLWRRRMCHARHHWKKAEPLVPLGNRFEPTQSRPPRPKEEQQVIVQMRDIRAEELNPAEEAVVLSMFRTGWSPDEIQKIVRRKCR